MCRGPAIVIVAGSNPGSPARPGTNWQRPGHRPLQHPAQPSVPPVDGWHVSSSYSSFCPSCTKNAQHNTFSSMLRHRHRRPTAGASPPHILPWLAACGSFTTALRQPRMPNLAPGQGSSSPQPSLSDLILPQVFRYSNVMSKQPPNKHKCVSDVYIQDVIVLHVSGATGQPQLPNKHYTGTKGRKCLWRGMFTQVLSPRVCSPERAFCEGINAPTHSW